MLARGVTGNTPAFDVGIERSNRSGPARDTFRPRRRVLLQRASSESGDLSSFMARRVLPARVGPLPRGATTQWTMTGRSEGRRGQASLNTNWHAEGALVRTPGFHSGNDGSSPFEVASSRKHEGRQRMVALQGIVRKRKRRLRRISVGDSAKGQGPVPWPPVFPVTSGKPHPLGIGTPPVLGVK